MAEGVQIQGIEFEIIGEATQAKKGVDGLASSLRKLKDVSGQGLGLGSIVSDLKSLTGALNKMKAANLENLASAFKNISASSGRISTIRDKLSEISNMDFSNLTKAASALGTISASGVKRGTGAAAGKAVDTATLPTDTPSERVEGTAGAMERVAAAAEHTAAAEKKVSTSGVYARQTLVELTKELGRTAIAAGKLTYKLVATPFLKLADSVRNTIAPIRQFLHSLGRIMMYRAVRSLISGLTSSLKEGMNNLYEYSKVAGTTFHQAMDTASTDALYLKNSLAAAVAPLINSLMPALDAVASKIAMILNLIAQLFAALGGKSTYSKAIKANKDFGSSVGGAAGAVKELRMLLSGFDELNPFPDQSGGGGGGGGGADFGSMFEESEINSKVAEFAKQLREAFLAGDWDRLGQLLGNKVNELFDRVDWDALGHKIGYGINGAISTAYSFLKTVDFKKRGVDMGTLLNGIISEINFETAGRLFIRTFTAWLDFLVGLIMTVDWGQVAQAIGNFLKGAFREAMEWLASVNWAELGATISNAVIGILDAIVEAVKEVDWKLVGKSIGDFLSNIDWWGIFSRVGEIVWTVFSEFISGMLSTSGGRIFLTLFAAIKGLSLAFTMSAPVMKMAAAQFVANGTSPLNAMVSYMKGFVKTMGNLLLVAVDLQLAYYDYNQIKTAAEGYHEAQVAHINETEQALNTYANLYANKGKEVADEWARMAYQVDTTNMDMAQGQEALTQRIEGLWDGVAENIGEGFLQGMQHYFGNGLGGIYEFERDALDSMISQAKSILGIHSPSTVYQSIGNDLTQGFYNGISEKWGTIDDFFATNQSNILKGFTDTWGKLKQNTNETFTTMNTNVTSKFSATCSSVTGNANALQSNVSSAWETAKTNTTNSWSQLSNNASTTFQGVHNTVVTKIGESTSYLNNTSWGNIGSNLVNGLWNGLKGAWNSVTSWVSNAASSLTNTLKSVLKIGSPSKEWELIGGYLDAGLQLGMEGGVNSLLGTAGKIAGAVSGAMLTSIPSPAAIADQMTPGGVEAAYVRNDYNNYDNEAQLSAISLILEQMFALMQAGNNQDTKIIIDGREVFRAVVNENNRAIQRTGMSPIRV